MSRAAARRAVERQSPTNPPRGRRGQTEAVLVLQLDLESTTPRRSHRGRRPRSVAASSTASPGSIWQGPPKEEGPPFFPAPPALLPRGARSRVKAAAQRSRREALTRLRAPLTLARGEARSRSAAPGPPGTGVRSGRGGGARGRRPMSTGYPINRSDDVEDSARGNDSAARINSERGRDTDHADGGETPIPGEGWNPGKHRLPVDTREG